MPAMCVSCICNTLTHLSPPSLFLHIFTCRTVLVSYIFCNIIHHPPYLFVTLMHSSGASITFWHPCTSSWHCITGCRGGDVATQHRLVQQLALHTITYHTSIDMHGLDLLLVWKGLVNCYNNLPNPSILV